MPHSATERQDLIRRYAEGPALLRAAFEKVPAEARQWRPAPDKWSAHEVIVHCADSESNASLRIRYLGAEKEPLIVGYDQEQWAKTFDYHSHPVDVALRTVEAVRANTVPLLRRLPESAWTREGKHTESGRYTGDDWLTSYATHLENHTRQIERNLEAWGSRKSGEVR
jgi:hypothetical protein